MYGVIYKVTNLVNGKIYIGQTTQSLNRRISEHCSDARNRCDSPFKRALLKYGFDNFQWETIDSSDTRQELSLREIYWIDYFKSYAHREDSNGYNLTFGGDGVGCGKNHPMYGKKNPFEGRKHTDESREKMRKNHVRLSGENHHMYGKNHTEEFKQKLKNERKTNIAQYDLDGNLVKIWDSAKEIKRQLGYCNAHIGRCCRNIYGKRKNVYQNFIWKYA